MNPCNCTTKWKEINMQRTRMMMTRMRIEDGPRMVWPGQSRGDPSLPGDPDGIDYHYTLHTLFHILHTQAIHFLHSSTQMVLTIIHPAHPLSHTTHPSYILSTQFYTDGIDYHYTLHTLYTHSFTSCKPPTHPNCSLSTLHSLTLCRTTHPAA